MFLWAAHLVAASAAGRTIGSGLARVSTAVWALAIDIGAFLVVYAVLSLAAAVAATRRRAFAWEFGLTAAIVAVAITELWRRIILPAFALFRDRCRRCFDSTRPHRRADVVWSRRHAGGFRRRVRHRPPDAGGAGYAPGRRHNLRIDLLTLVAAALVTARIEQFDWANILHSFVALAEATIVFGVFIVLWSRAGARTWSPVAAVAPPLAAVDDGYTPRLAFAARRRCRQSAARAASWPSIAWRPRTRSRVSRRGGLIEQPAFDIGYFRDVLARRDPGNRRWIRRARRARSH